MPHTVMAAALQDVPKANQIALDVSRWIVKGVAHTGLGRQMDHRSRLMLSKQRRHGGAILQIKALKSKPLRRARHPSQTIKPCLLESRVVIGIEVVDA